jgi:hypothetical protein
MDNQEREIRIQYRDIDTILVNGRLYKDEFDLYAGFTDEDDATVFKIDVPSNWEGTFFIGLQPNGEDIVYTEVDFDTDNTPNIEFPLPSQVVGQHRMVLKVVDDETIITKPIFFRIKKI